MEFSQQDRDALAAAVRRLEAPGFAGRLVALAGRPATLVARALPAPAAAVVAKAADRALARALEIAVFSLSARRIGGGRILHSALASASGAVGGAFGVAALAVELPVSTAIMLRAIAAIALDEGEDLSDPRTGLACLEVFALGRTGPRAETVESGYFAVRATLARGLSHAADMVVNLGVGAGGSAAIMRVLSPLAARYGTLVSEKLAVQAVAVVGAIGGAAINLAFVEHFQEQARGHFSVRRLERIYGAENVRAEFDLLRRATTSQPRLALPSPARGAHRPAP
jgi:EcsC protein family